MANSAVTEGAKAAGSFFEAMRSQPLGLALVLCNLALLALFYYFLSKVYERREADQALLYAQTNKVNEMLLACIPAGENIRRNVALTEENMANVRRALEQSTRNGQELDQLLELLKKPLAERK